MPETSSSQLKALFAEEWEFRMQENPTFATQAGDHRYNDRLPGVREEDFARREKILRIIQQRLNAIGRESIPTAQRIDYDFFARELQIQIDDLSFGTQYIPITKTNGVPVYLPDVVLITPFRAAEDYEKYIRRLRGFGRLSDDLIDLMRTGVAKGYLPSRWALAGVVDGFRMHAASQGKESVFFEPFNRFPSSVSETERGRLRGEGLGAISQAVLPGYQALANFIEKEYLPAIPEEIVTVEMPDLLAKKHYYEFCIRRYTSLDLSPREIHGIGLNEVKRIRAEMSEVMHSVGFNGTLRAFSDTLRSDPRFFVDTPDALMKEVAYLMKRIEGLLPGLFKTLPRTPFGLREIPAHIAPTSTSAYYMLPGGDGATAGFYYVNTYDLKSRPLYELEALSLHEAVPGHHLQLALQLEMTDVLPFRKWGETTAFIEGWALYAERLGLEMGFYRDLYSNFGRLIYEMWRAARLVVDTGLHAIGWSRQQAIDYLAENTALSLLNIANEVDRYIAWPGQALAYKIGELKIRALRQQAEETLGPRFDLRAFHEVVLRNGGIPLAVMDQNIQEWLAD